VSLEEVANELARLADELVEPLITRSSLALTLGERWRTQPRRFEEPITPMIGL
jgi:hypothetical protein